MTSISTTATHRECVAMAGSRIESRECICGLPFAAPDPQACCLRFTHTRGGGLCNKGSFNRKGSINYYKITAPVLQIHLEILEACQTLGETRPAALKTRAQHGCVKPRSHDGAGGPFFWELHFGVVAWPTVGVARMRVCVHTYRKRVHMHIQTHTYTTTLSHFKNLNKNIHHP